MIDFLLAYPKPTNDSPLKLTPLSILFPGTWAENWYNLPITVEYWDERFDSLEMFDALVADSKEIGVSAFTGFQTGQAARLLQRAKEKNPKIITSVGGYHATLLPDQVLDEPFVDFVWNNPPYGEDLFPYNKKTKIHFQRTEMQYFTSRGCPHNCSFCALRSPWIPKDIKVLERELKIMHNDLGFTEISFSDPNIVYCSYNNADGKRERMDRVARIKQIGKIMRDLNVKWDGNIRSPYLTPEMVEALEESNCYSIEIGCESGNDYFLKRIIKKGHGVQAIKDAAVNVSKSSLSVMYSFMANMPRETKSMLNDTLDLIDWIVATDPHARVSIYNYAPYPGSPMYEDAVNGVDGYPKFIPPTTMEGWGNLKLMQSPLYWIAGLNFRRDNSRKNFPGEDWKIIEPYIKLAEKKWRERDTDTFPCEEVEKLISKQLQGGN